MLDDFERLKREVAEEQRLQDQDQGSYNEMRRILKKKYGVKNLKEAEALAEKLLAEVHNITDEYLVKKKRYEKLLAKAKKARNRGD